MWTGPEFSNLKRLCSFSELMLIRNFLFSTRSFGRDHDQSELDISPKDDVGVYLKMD